MPTEERGPTGQVKPSGWHTVKHEHDRDGYTSAKANFVIEQTQNAKEYDGMYKRNAHVAERSL